MKKGEKIKVLRSSNFHVTTGMNFIFVDEPGVCINVLTLAHQDNSPKGLYIKFLAGSSEFTHN